MINLTSMKALRLLIISLLVTCIFVFPVFAMQFTSDEVQGLIKKNAIMTEHFRLEYSKLIGNQVDSDGDGIVDVIETIAQAAEDSWDYEIDILGYNPPISEDRKVMIILDETNQYLYENTLGVTSVLSNGDPYIAIDPFLSDDYLKVTMAHEFFHVIQFDYNWDFAVVDQGINWAESTATWAEDIVFDSVNDYINYLPDFFEYPDYSIFGSIIPNDSLFEYGLNIWPRYLSEVFGDGIIKDIWDAYDSSNADFEDHLKLFEVVKDVISDEGSDLQDVYLQFALQNLDLEDYEEGDLYPEILQLKDTVQGEYTLVDAAYAPALYSSNYLVFDNDDKEESFYFHVVKSEGLSVGVTLIAMYGDDADTSNTASFVIDKDTEMEEELVLNDVEDADSVIAIVSSLEVDFDSGLNTDVFDEGYSYYYLAQYGTSIKDVIVEEDLTEPIDEDETGKEGEVSGESDGIKTTDGLILDVVNYDEDSVSLSWNRITDDDVEGYEVYYGMQSGDYDEVYEIDKAYTTFATINDLEAGETYYFQVIAVTADGDQVGDESSEIAVIPEEWLFDDLSALDTHYDAISTLVDLGIFSGYSDGTFQANGTINRAELLKILIEAGEINPNEDIYKNCFPDVTTEWYAKYVCYAEAKGWVVGYPDGTFLPGNTVNKVEALKILFNVYESGLTEGTAVADLPYPDLSMTTWYSIYVQEASELGILEETPEEDFNADSGRTRGDMAEELYRYLVVSKDA